MGERPGAMAELMLDEWAQLAEGLVVLGDQEQGIVAEPLGPAGSRVSRPRQAPSASSRIVPAGSASAGRSERPRRGGRRAVCASASSTLRLLASSSVGSPA